MRLQLSALLPAVFMLLLPGCATQNESMKPQPPSLVKRAPRIPLAQVQLMFDQMRARSNWNVDEPLLWGYFFYDADYDKLKRAAPALEAMGYRVVCIDGHRYKYFIHIERAETHTPQTLFARNDEFYDLARKLELESYDGMDVGPVNGKKQCGRYPR